MARARRWTRRLHRASLYALVAILLLSAILRTATYLYRLRAEHLMADLQSLQLRHSTWPEAQRLITRWGPYGHYEGTCDASFCRYAISLESPAASLAKIVRRFPRLDSLVAPPIVISQLVGGRGALLEATLVVQDGIVLRKGAVFTYDVLSLFSSPVQYTLIASSRTTRRVSPDEWYLSGTSQLVEHPFYVVTRPDGCTFCMMARVTFAPDTPADQMHSLLTFNFGCLTSLTSCKAIEDIYPAAEPWHLYDGTIGGRPKTAETPDRYPPLANACAVPLFARAREADEILAVTAVTESQHTDNGILYEPASVKLDDVLKGSARHKIGGSMDVLGIADGRVEPLQIELPLTPTKHFLLISFSGEAPNWPLELNRCSVIPDTPENRAQLQLGIAQNDTLRHPDPRPDWFIPE